jgi:xanthine dehydrogenase YagT iron-sulfur-binding subunit
MLRDTRSRRCTRDRAQTIAAEMEGDMAMTPPTSPTALDGHKSTALTLRVNGVDRALQIDPRATLLDALREYLGLFGTKKGCDRGECGACTVLVDGRRINACLTFAIMQQGHEITTIEGLAQGDQLHPIQAAFIEQDAFQCGYCTPGQIISAAALLQEGHTSSEAEIREWMSGNICRCGAYPNVVAAIQQVAGSTRS